MGALCSLNRSYEETGMRVIDCNECGCTIGAANDEELVRHLSQHMTSQHSETDWDDERASTMVAKRAYDATDS
jgi:predicted small metal-binding protein